MSVDAKTKRQLEYVLGAARAICEDDPSEVLATLIGAIATFCGQRRGAVQLLDIAIDALMRAKAELSTNTGAPAGKPAGAPS